MSTVRLAPKVPTYLPPLVESRTAPHPSRSTSGPCVGPVAQGGSSSVSFGRFLAEVQRVLRGLGGVGGRHLKIVWCDSKALEAQKVMQAPGEMFSPLPPSLGGGVVSICGNYGPKGYRWAVSVLPSTDSSR